MASNSLSMSLIPNPNYLNLSLVWSRRGQWLRPAILRASDGFVFAGSLMMGIMSVKEDVKVMIVFNSFGLVTDACSMVIRELVSLCTKRVVEVDQMRREKRKGHPTVEMMRNYRIMYKLRWHRLWLSSSVR
ncbi:vacuolar iron transporter homolog 2.1-like [Hibiscus syriacus]|uniref:vacuolar iron transporter homolog 2.1-like n=1 Tax=Hibiscus syriacus TaxID=106335 RepID=UPI0019244408|nr:vacuolar iron transporter homolog 2.1-like [Hibiscus syriacus]